MGELIDDLLQLSKVSRAKVTIEAVDLSQLARSILRELGDREPQRRVATDVQDGVGISGDPRLLRIALENLRAHKLRSFLTLLGVIIAVTALIGVVSAVEGLNTYVAERVANFGTNVFYITRYPIITNAKDYFEARRRNRKMTFEDLDYLREHLTLAHNIAFLDVDRKKRT